MVLQRRRGEWGGVKVVYVISCVVEDIVLLASRALGRWGDIVDKKENNQLIFHGVGEVVREGNPSANLASRCLMSRAESFLPPVSHALGCRTRRTTRLM